MFHGFAASTGQMARLAQYLFENGFNVYQPALCAHYYNAKYWPKVRWNMMKPHVKCAICLPPLNVFCFFTSGGMSF
jgi:esterase/lipase